VSMSVTRMTTAAACPRTLDAYPFTIDLRALFSDVDGQQHINNVAIAGYFAEGRASLNQVVFGQKRQAQPSPGQQILIASVTIDYLGQGQYPGTFRVAAGVTEIGRSSFRVAQALFQLGHCVAVASTVMVNAVEGRPAPLPAEVRTALSDNLLRDQSLVAG